MNDNSDMQTSKHSPHAKAAGLQSQPLKDAEGVLKKAKTLSASQSVGEKLPDQSAAQEEELGTFDKVYEHGRQMGF